jgi:hypothetical protein
MLLVAQLVRYSPAFMEPEGSLPCSQSPTSSPYTEIKPVHTISTMLLEGPFQYYPPIYA